MSLSLFLAVVGVSCMYVGVGRCTVITCVMYSSWFIVEGPRFLSDGRIMKTSKFVVFTYVSKRSRIDLT